MTALCVQCRSAGGVRRALDGPLLPPRQTNRIGDGTLCEIHDEEAEFHHWHALWMAQTVLPDTGRPIHNEPRPPASLLKLGEVWVPSKGEHDALD